MTDIQKYSYQNSKDNTQIKTAKARRQFFSNKTCIFYPLNKYRMAHNTLILDPGVKSLGLKFSQANKAWLFHFDDIYEISRNSFFLDILKSLKSFGPFELLCEDQHIKRNCVLEGFICGIISSVLEVLKIFSIPSRLKSTYAKEVYNFDYKKIKSKKAYNTLPQAFRDVLSRCTIFEVSRKGLESRKFADLKKQDDLIDIELYDLHIQKYKDLNTRK